MGRKSTIDLLPLDIQIQLVDWLKASDITIDEARDRTNELLDALGLEDLKLTRSAVGRKNKRIHDDIERIGKEMRATKAATADFYDRFGDELGEGGKFLAETMQAFILKLNLALFKIQDIEASDVLDHSKAVKNLTGAIVQIEEALTKYTNREAEIKKQTLMEAAKNIEKTAKARGMTADEAEFWRNKVLMGV